MDRSKLPLAIACPQCGGQAVWHQSNPFRPFCSERCKLIDFGHWASETYRMPEAHEELSRTDNDEV
ncbi:MAG: DNA gyrase inhibitor YacG [Burkholderiales bacterium]